jgi:hypothetical protein
MAGLNFDATNVAPDAGREVVPEDWYDLQVTGSEIKPTNGEKGPGAQLVAEITVISGKYANRKMWSRFNVQNPNPEAVRIGYAQLSALCHAVGVLQVADSQQLHGIPFKGKVKIRKGGVRPEGGNYDDQNEVSVYKHASDPQPTNTVANAPSLPGAATAGGTPSWAAQPAAAAPVAAAPAAGAAPSWAAPAAPAPAAAAPVAAAPVAAQQAAPAGAPGWANGQPTQPAAAPAAQAAAPAQPDHPAVAAAQAAQPPFVMAQAAAPVAAAATPTAPVQAPTVASTPAPGFAPAQAAAPAAEAAPSWAQQAAPAGQTPSWAQ